MTQQNYLSRLKEKILMQIMQKKEKNNGKSFIRPKFLKRKLNVTRKMSFLVVLYSIY